MCCFLAQNDDDIVLCCPGSPKVISRSLAKSLGVMSHPLFSHRSR